MARRLLVMLVGVSVLAGCGGGGAKPSGTGGSGPVCREFQEACAITADCCGALICIENLCVRRLGGTDGGPATGGASPGTGGAVGTGGAASSGGAPGTGGRPATGGATGTGGAPPMCRGATQACAVTADCCASLVCTGNMCLTPPTCRPTGGACAVTADCCNPFVCLGGSCQTAPTDVCGDARCTGAESTATCCRDCGCPTGTTCNGASCVNVGTSTMTWNITNSCTNGESIQVRFFDVTNLMVWPAELTMVYVVGLNETRTHPLACTTGATICFGANQPDHLLYWGLDIDASKPCASCCATCSTTSITQPLVCN